MMCVCVCGGGATGTQTRNLFLRHHLFLFLEHLLPLGDGRLLLVEVILRFLYGLLQGLLLSVVLSCKLPGLADALQHLGPLLGVLQSDGLHCSLAGSETGCSMNNQQ